MNCKRLLGFTGRLKCCQVRFKHGLPSATVNDSLPPNLVLFGVSKEKTSLISEQVFGPPSDDIPLIRSCTEKIPTHKSPISAWVDNFMNDECKYEVAAQLHPQVFGVHPRMDILHEVVMWQKSYREVDYAWSRTRADTGRGKRKPWPQKGTGRVRQGSRNAPHWKGGGICRGPRGPRSLFYQLSDNTLVQGLTIALTIKHIQQDLILMENLDIPEEEKEKKFYDFLDKRNLSENSILFVHSKRNRPENLCQILETSEQLSVMPAQALNVYSMLKHDKLVLPIEILDDLEKKIVWQLTRYNWLGMAHNFYKDMPGSEGLKADRQYEEYESLYGRIDAEVK